MNRDLAELLQVRDGVLTRADALTVASDDALAHAIRHRQLVRIFPRVYVAPATAADRRTREIAALRYAGGVGALSHTTALRWYTLALEPSPHIHVTVPATCRLRGAGGLVVHRRQHFALDAPHVAWRDDVPVVRLERALAESWPLLDMRARRAPAIVAVQRRMTTPQRLFNQAVSMPNLHGRASLLALCDVRREGCHSELEIWGYREVFSHPSLPQSVRQLPVRLGNRMIYIDVAYLAEMVAFELDGRQYHSDPRQHESDLRRDAELAALGWLTVRLTHARLREPDQVRREVMRVLDMRRRQLRLAS